MRPWWRLLEFQGSQGNSCPKSLLGQVCSHIRSIGAGFKCSCVSRFADFCCGSNSTFVRVMRFLFQRREGGLTGLWGSSRVAFASLVSLELFGEDCWLGKRFHIQQLGFWLAPESFWIVIWTLTRVDTVVVADSSVQCPWHLTKQFSRCVTKLPHVSASFG